MLIVFAGLPGTGKATLARLVARRIGAAHLRVDVVEAAMTRAGMDAESIDATGYAVVEEVARSCLSVGTPVVVDAISPVPEARQAWRTLAVATGEDLVMIEVQVRERREHRRRVENRRSDVEGLTVPTWRQVTERDYRPWDDARDGPRLVLLNDGDTAITVATVLAHLRTRERPEP